MADPITTAVGAGADAFNALTGLGFGIYDRIRQNGLDKYNVLTDQRDFKYLQQMNEQAQKNFEAQMGFQQQQADLAQSNWEQQFNLQKQIQESNRIGNLTKEYQEAGLNPFLAAGMGASTASAVGGGATTPGASAPNFKSATSKTLNSQSGTIPQATMDNLIATIQLKMQKEMNDANILKLNADAELARTQADELTTTRQTRIDKIKSEIGLNEDLAEEAVVRANKLKAEESYTKQLEKLAKAETTGKEMYNDIEKIKHDLLESFPEMERQRIMNEWKKPYFENKMKQLDMMINSAEFNRATVVEREKLIKGWFDSTIGLMIKAGSGSGVFTF